MKYITELFLALIAFISPTAHATDTYDHVKNELTIPAVVLGETIYRDVVITVGPILTVGGSNQDPKYVPKPSTTFDSYDPYKNQLTIPNVNAYGFVYYDVVVNVGTVLSVKSSEPVVKPAIALQKTSYLNMKNVGLSRIKFPDSLRTITPDQPLAWTAGDFFKNGTLDIFTAKQNYSMDTNKFPTNSVVSNEQYKSDFQFWRKDADGNLTLLLTYKGCLHPRKALVDDFNKDGFPDVFVACTGYDGLVDGKSPGEKNKFLMNNGKGGFTVTDTSDTGYYHGAASADINGDGYPDIVVANLFNQQVMGSQGINVHFLINQKNGTFVADNTRVTGTTPWVGYWSVELVDINNDGIMDLVAGGDDKNNANAVILYGSANGTFGSTKEVIPAVAGRGTIMDFTYVVNNGKKTLYIARTADNTDSQSWYSTNTLQAYDLTTKTATVVLDKLNTIWEAWWLPTTRNGQNGVASYTAFREDLFISQ